MLEFGGEPPTLSLPYRGGREAQLADGPLVMEGLPGVA